MADNENIVVELSADDAAEVVVTENNRVEAEDPIEALKKQYDELRARDEANARALEVSRQNEAKAREEAQRNAVEAERAKTQVVSSELQANVNAIAAQFVPAAEIH